MGTGPAPRPEIQVGIKADCWSVGWYQVVGRSAHMVVGTLVLGHWKGKPVRIWVQGMPAQDTAHLLLLFDC